MGRNEGEKVMEKSKEVRREGGVRGRGVRKG